MSLTPSGSFNSLTVSFMETVSSVMIYGVIYRNISGLFL